MNGLTLGSLFDGIGGFPLAAQRYGIKTQWASEIEPNCIAITKRHFPDMVHLGSLTEIDGGKIPPVDIISFGSPCQDLSVAGAQKGMKLICPECGQEFSIDDDISTCPYCGADIEKTRSGLFVEAVRIIYEMRCATNGKYPTFIIWENVPGAFASNGGGDFRRVLEEITKSRISMPVRGKWAKAGMVRTCGVEVAWRQLDAQYWGVPQRRKRIFLVADFGGQRAAEILFKCESLLGYSQQGKAEGKRIAADSESGVGTSSGIAPNGRVTAGFLDRAPAGAGSIGFEEEKSPCLRASMTPSIVDCQNVILDDQGGNVIAVYENGICPTLRAQTHGHLPCVIGTHPINDAVIHGAANGLGIGEDGDPAPTLTGRDRHGVGFYKAYGVVSKGNGEAWVIPEKHMSLTTGGGQAGQGFPCVMESISQSEETVVCFGRSGDRIRLNAQKSATLVATDGGGGAATGIYMLPEKQVFEEYRHGEYRETEVTGTLRASGGGCGPGSESLVVSPPERTTAGFSWFVSGESGSMGYEEEKSPCIRATRPPAAMDVCTCQIPEKNKSGWVTWLIRYILRKLTPLECERLQGYPDEWTRYGYDGEEIKDTPRYVAIGNSLAVPCAERVFRGIMAVLSR